MTAKKFEGMVATVFAIAVVSGLVYAQVSRVDMYQGIASMASRQLGFGCQLRVLSTGGRVSGYIPSFAPNSFFEQRIQPFQIRTSDNFLEMESSYGSETITIHFQKKSNGGVGAPFEYEFRRASRPDSVVYCRDLEFEVSGAPD